MEVRNHVFKPLVLHHPLPFLLTTRFATWRYFAELISQVARMGVSMDTAFDQINLNPDPYNAFLDGSTDAVTVGTI